MKSQIVRSDNRKLVSDALNNSSVRVLKHSKSLDGQEEIVIIEYNSTYDSARYRMNISNNETGLLISIFGKNDCNMNEFTAFLTGDHHDHIPNTDLDL